jgi:hypothetical protein
MGAISTLILILAMLGVMVLWICLGFVVVEEIKAVYNYYKEARNVSPRNR